MVPTRVVFKAAISPILVKMEATEAMEAMAEMEATVDSLSMAVGRCRRAKSRVEEMAETEDLEATVATVDPPQSTLMAEMEEAEEMVEMAAMVDLTVIVAKIRIAAMEGMVVTEATAEMVDHPTLSTLVVETAAREVMEAGVAIAAPLMEEMDATVKLARTAAKGMARTEVTVDMEGTEGTAGMAARGLRRKVCYGQQCRY